MSIARRLAVWTGPAALLFVGFAGRALEAEVGAGARTAPVAALDGRRVAVEQHWLRRPASLGIENAYRDMLQVWATGSPEAALQYAEFQILVVEAIAGTRVQARNYHYEEVRRGLSCVAEVERNTIARLGGLDPDLYLAVSSFHLLIYRYLVAGVGLHWLADLNWERLEESRRGYLNRHGAPPAGEENRLAALEISIGGALEGLGLIGQLERAQDAFERATRFAPQNPVARYWLGFLDEKLDSHRRALASFEWLVERSENDHEAALRSALLGARAGLEAEARRALETLAAGDGAISSPDQAADWIRILAAQELSRLIAPSDPERAVEILRRARREHSGEASLTLQLAELLGHGSPESLDLLEALVESRPTSKPSPRLLYEQARTEGLETEVGQFEIWLSGKLPVLAEAIETVKRSETTRDGRRRHGAVSSRDLRTGLQSPDVQRVVFKNCSGFELPRK